MLRILLGDASADEAEIAGRLCLRVYPRAASDEVNERLGAHCDATLFTLLWSTAPGLQVLDPDTAHGWTARNVMEFGVPSMGSVGDEPPELREGNWATVDAPWAEGALLLSLGTGWHSSRRAAAAFPAQCAVLHRVAVTNLAEDRLSLPFLVDWSRPDEA